MWWIIGITAITTGLLVYEEKIVPYIGRRTKTKCSSCGEYKRFFPTRKLKGGGLQFPGTGCVNDNCPDRSPTRFDGL